MACRQAQKFQPTCRTQSQLWAAWHAVNGVQRKLSLNTKYQDMMLSTEGAPLMPAGGSVCRRLKSRINLRFAGVVICRNYSSRKTVCVGCVLDDFTSTGRTKSHPNLWVHRPQHSNWGGRSALLFRARCFTRVEDKYVLAGAPSWRRRSASPDSPRCHSRSAQRSLAGPPRRRRAGRGGRRAGRGRARQPGCESTPQAHARAAGAAAWWPGGA